MTQQMNWATGGVCVYAQIGYYFITILAFDAAI